MTGIALVLALWTTRTINPLRGDTFEYAYFDPSRTLGYPAFLWLVRSITGHIALAVPAQMILVAGSLLLLGQSFHALVGRPRASLAFQAILLGQVGIWKASAFLMSEGLSTALIATWCAQLLRLIKSPSSRGLIVLTVISGIATTVRPSLVALFFGTALFVFAALPRRSRGRSFAIIALGAVVAWGGTPAAQLLIHGSARTTSPLARGVLQHTLYCDPHIALHGAESAFVEQAAAPVRNYIGAAPAQVQEQLRRAYSTPLRFGLIIPMLGRRHGLDSRSEVDPILWRVAKQRVAANPLCYGKSVAGAYYRMATFDVNRTTWDERQTRHFLASHPPVPIPQVAVLSSDGRRIHQIANEVGNQPSGLNPEQYRLDVKGKIPGIVLLPGRMLYGVAALLGLMSLAAVAFRRRPGSRLQAGVAAMGAGLHGVLAITAIVELGLSRYVLPLWPIACALVATALLSLFETYQRDTGLVGAPRRSWARPWMFLECSDQ